ncbi:hypothetical protein ACJX0J_034483 [Zea mays]
MASKDISRAQMAREWFAYNVVSASLITLMAGTCSFAGIVQIENFQEYHYDTEVSIPRFPLLFSVFSAHYLAHLLDEPIVYKYSSPITIFFLPAFFFTSIFLAFFSFQ